ncbi:conserved hypothetical protein [Verrucomicrobia bacterium]|nr:conserved hypothetical protein [Verrucomicrobiota bacterium]
MISLLQPPDSFHLQAAQGWFELGNLVEAAKELEQITPELHGHPDVLVVRVRLAEAAGQWEHVAEVARKIAEALPDNHFGWFMLAYALHELKRTKEAREILVSVAAKFPEEFLMRYNLACYACRLGDLKEAREWLEQAVALAGAKQIKDLALKDPDLEPLWGEVREF